MRKLEFSLRGAIANPQNPQVPTPGAWPQQQNKNSVQYIFFYMWEHTKFGIKIFEIDMVIEI